MSSDEIKDIYEEFHKAIDNQDKAKIKQLITLIKLKDVKYFHRISGEVLSHDNPDMYIYVSTVLEKDIEYEAQEDMHYAIKNGKENMVRFFIPMVNLNDNLLDERTDDGDLEDISGTNPINVALESNNLRILDILIQNGAIAHGQDFETAGRIKEPEFLLKLISSLETYQQYIDGMISAIGVAIHVNNIDLANFILDYDIEYAEEKKDTNYRISEHALLVAIDKRNLQLVEKILSNRYIKENIIKEALLKSTRSMYKDFVLRDTMFKIMIKIKDDPRSEPFNVNHLKNSISSQDINITSYILKHSTDLPIEIPSLCEDISRGLYGYDISILLLKWFARHENPEVRAIPFKEPRIRKNLLPLAYSLTELEKYQMEGLYEAPSSYSEYKYEHFRPETKMVEYRANFSYPTRFNYLPNGDYTYDWKDYVNIYILNHRDREIQELNNLFGIDFKDIANSAVVLGALSIISDYMD